MMLKFNSAYVKEKIRTPMALAVFNLSHQHPRRLKPFRPSFNHKIVLGTAFSLVPREIPEYRCREKQAFSKEGNEEKYEKGDESNRYSLDLRLGIIFNGSQDGKSRVEKRKFPLKATRFKNLKTINKFQHVCQLQSIFLFFHFYDSILCSNKNCKGKL